MPAVPQRGGCYLVSGGANESGAWYSSQHHIRRVIHRHKVDVYLRYVGRDSSAAPAAGYMALHMEQLNNFIDESLGDIPWGH